MDVLKCWMPRENGKDNWRTWCKRNSRCICRIYEFQKKHSTYWKARKGAPVELGRELSSIVQGLWEMARLSPFASKEAQTARHNDDHIQGNNFRTCGSLWQKFHGARTDAAGARSNTSRSAARGWHGNAAATTRNNGRRIGILVKFVAKNWSDTRKGGSYHTAKQTYTHWCNIIFSVVLLFGTHNKVLE